MKIQDIEIHVGKADFPFTPVRQLEVTCEATTAFQSAPNIEEANSKLRELAAKVGANAVIEVEYRSGISLTSWRSMKAVGLAVIRPSDEMNCPVCAEKIKTAAKKCRHCGVEISEEQRALSVPNAPAFTATGAAANAEPLRATNNTGIWWIMGSVALIMILGAIASASQY